MREIKTYAKNATQRLKKIAWEKVREKQ